MKTNIHNFIKLTPIYPRYTSRASLSTKHNSISINNLTPLHKYKISFCKNNSHNNENQFKQHQYGKTIDVNNNNNTNNKKSLFFMTTLPQPQSFTPTQVIKKLTFYSKLKEHNINTNKTIFHNSLIKNAINHNKHQINLYKTKLTHIFSESKFLSNSLNRNNDNNNNRKNTPMHIEIRNPHFDYKSIYTKIRFQQVLGVHIMNKKLISRLYHLGMSP